MNERGRVPRRVLRAGGVERVDDEHNAPLAHFLNEAWGQESSESEVGEWRARDARTNPVEPGVEPPKWVFTRNHHVIGYVGSIPTRFMLDGNVRQAHWLKGFWVLPQYRSGPVGFAVLQQALTDLRVVASTVVAEPARRLMEAGGMLDLGVFFNRLKVLEPGKLLRDLDVASLDLQGAATIAARGVRMVQRVRATRLAGAVLNAGTVILAGTRGRLPRGVSFTEGFDSATEVDLDYAWSAFRGTVRAAAVRDGALVRWRYATWDKYNFVGVWSGGRLRAWSVVRKSSLGTEGRMKGLSLASLSDVLFPADEPDLGLAAVLGAERLAKRMNADALLCSGTHAALEAVLARRGFLSVPPNLHLLVRDPEATEPPPTITEWWLTRGDGQSDESF